MDNGNSFPVPMFGRRSDGMTTQDWTNLASAYDTWNDHLAASDEVDPDLREFVKDVFDEHGLWNPTLEEPDVLRYRQMIYNLC